MKEKLERLLEPLLEGTDLHPEDLLKGILVAGLVFSFIHLLTMLVTRWGDSRASSKAFVFSLLIHVMCLLGFVANVDPATFAKADTDPDEEPLVLRDVKLEDPERPRDRDPGNSSIWNRVAEPVNEAAARRELDPRETPPVDDPRRLLNEDRDPKPFEVADARPNVDRNVETPAPEDVVAGRSSDATPNAPTIPERDRQRRDDVTVPTPGQRRERAEFAGLDSNLVRRSIDAGGVPVQRPEVRRIERNVDGFPLPSPIRIDRSKPKPDDTIARRTGPTPGPIRRDPGTQSDAAAGGGLDGAPSPRRLAGGRRPSDRDSDGGSLVRRTPRDVSGIGRPSRLDTNELGRRPPTLARADPALSIERPSFETNGPSRIAPPLPTARRLDPNQRRDIARRRGGSPESEEAVDRALAWLSRVQNASGYWDADRFGAGRVKWVAITENGEQAIQAGQRASWERRGNAVVDRDNAGRNADTGITGLALLAFLAAGENEFDGRYARTVRTATDWLLEQQDEETGALHGSARYYARTYCHAIATFALAEATRTHIDYASPEVPRLQAALRRAVQLIANSQNPGDGGWRYRPQTDAGKSDTSVFGWQLMALVTAEKAGVSFPTGRVTVDGTPRTLDTRRLMIQFLKDRSLDANGRPSATGGLAAYRPNERVTATMTAEALFCKQRLGLRRDNVASTQAVAYLRRNLPNRERFNLYYWYYGTLAMFHHGGDAWQDWNGRLRDLLVAEQETKGNDAGSWAPRSVWSAYGGRVYSTAMATLCLESYYRFFEQSDDIATRRPPTRSRTR